MNKFKHVFLLILVALTTFNACEKDELESEQSQSFSNQNYELPSELKVNLQQANGLLVFKDRQQFDQITNLLLSETERYIDMYFSKYDDSLSDETVNELVEADEFNPNLVYETFEKHHSIHSLRALHQELEDKWLEKSKDLTIETNPTIYALSDRCINIATVDGEYMIGTTIYRAEADGLVYEIRNSDFSALKTIREGNSSFLAKSDNPNVIIHRSEVRSDLNGTKASCKAFLRRTADYNYANKKKMHCIIDIDWDGYGSAAKAKAKCYKRVKRWGKWKWKRHWTDMGTQVQVLARDIKCNIKTQIGEEGYIWNRQDRSWAYFVTTHVYAPGAGMRVKPGEFGGIFRKDGYNEFSVSW